MRRGRTCEGWPDHRGNSLEHEQEAKSICQLVKAQQIDEDDTGQPNVGSTGHPKDGAVHDLPVVGGHEAAEAHGDATEDQAGVVEVESVDEALVAQPSKEKSAKCVGNADDGEEKGGLLLIDVPASGPVNCVHVRHVEPYARQEVTDGIHEKYWISEETEVDHLAEHSRILFADLATADLGILLPSAQLARLRCNLSHRTSVGVRVVPGNEKDQCGKSYFRSGSLELRYVVERSAVEDVLPSHNPRRRRRHLTLFDILSDNVG